MFPYDLTFFYHSEQLALLSRWVALAIEKNAITFFDVCLKASSRLVSLRSCRGFRSLSVETDKSTPKEILWQENVYLPAQDDQIRNNE